MNNLQTSSRSWVKQKSRLKSLYPQLVEVDFEYEYGKKEQMMDNLQQKIGVTRADLNELIFGSKFKERKIYR